MNVPQGGSVVNTAQYKKEAIHIMNRVNLLDLPYRHLLEPEFSGFYRYQDSACAVALVDKYRTIKKARIMRVENDMPVFLSKTFYSTEWGELVWLARDYIASVEDKCPHYAIFFVPLNDGWAVVDNVQQFLRTESEIE